jgi:tetraacyldisaccharide 4'-kinase
MSKSMEQYGRSVMSGADNSVPAILLRAGLSMIEPLYAALMAGRNLLYDSQAFATHSLPRPVISVGNITAGGTGKTPVVRWLADELRKAGHRPAILLRGYKVGSGVTSDEQVMLDHHLNDETRAPVRIGVNPSRTLAGQSMLEEHPDVTVFILDDAFQHRQLEREMDLVLINAADPFGYEHVHPRGLLREPLRSLQRADAFIITRADQVSPVRRRDIERRIRQQNRRAPIYRANHAHTGLRSSGCSAADDPDCAIDDLSRRPFFAFCGIGNPASFQRQLEELEGRFVGHHWFPDHHDYTEQDIIDVKRQAKEAGAELVVTTEKDWVKISGFSVAQDHDPEIWRTELEIEFWDDEGQRLLDQIRQKIDNAGRPEPGSTVTGAAVAGAARRRATGPPASRRPVAGRW